VSEEPVQPVELTLNESGMLCHMLLRHIMDTKASAKGSAILTPAVQRSVIRQLEHLYAKLAAANDRLMGKT